MESDKPLSLLFSELIFSIWFPSSMLSFLILSISCFKIEFSCLNISNALFGHSSWFLLIVGTLFDSSLVKAFMISSHSLWVPLSQFHINL